MMGEKDFFDDHFNMDIYPKFFNTEEGRILRSKLSKFFYRFIKFYRSETDKTGFNPTFFMLNTPFNLLLGLNDHELGLVFSNDYAIRGRTALYLLKGKPTMTLENLYLDSKMCGFGEQATSFKVDVRLIEEHTSDQLIETQAKNLVNFEINRWEQDNKIMRINPFFGDINYKVNSRKVFMLMPFAFDDLNEFYEDHIKPSVEKIDMNCLRADDIFNNKSIIEDIWRNINEAQIVIADLTNRNPNVFYEVGIAHTLGKHVILISQKEEDIPFDLRHVRTIFYSTTKRGGEAFEEQLISTIKGVLETHKIE